MSRHELHTTTEDSFGAPAHPDVVAFLEKSAPQRTVLELGASGGRLTLPLAKAGFTVFIIDDSPSAIRGYMTKPGAENIQLVRADFRRARLEEVFGAVIVGPASLSRLRTLRAQLELLATAADHITANGIVMVETMTSQGEPPSGATPTRQPGIGLRFPALPELDLMAHTPATAQGARLRRRPIRRTVLQRGQRIPLWTVVIAANSDGHLTGARRVVGRSPLAK